MHNKTNDELIKAEKEDISATTELKEQKTATTKAKLANKTAKAKAAVEAAVETKAKATTPVDLTLYDLKLAELEKAKSTNILKEAISEKTVADNAHNEKLVVFQQVEDKLLQPQQLSDLKAAMANLIQERKLLTRPQKKETDEQLKKLNFQLKDHEEAVKKKKRGVKS